MKYAIIANILSNYEALISTLEDIKKHKVDKIICLGDTIGKGENAHKCIELVRKHCDVVVAGNTDIRFSGDAEEFKQNAQEYKRILWNKSLMTQDDMAYLQSLPICYELKAGNKLIRMFHATPYSVFKHVHNYDTDMSEKYSLFLPSEFTSSQEKADIVIYGHLHYQYLSLVYNRVLVCCGSVGDPNNLIHNEEKNGNPENVCKAQYLILEIDENNNVSYCFKACDYDIDAELKSNKTNPEFEDYKIELTQGKYRDMTKVNKAFEAQGYDTSKF